MILFNFGKSSITLGKPLTLLCAAFLLDKKNRVTYDTVFPSKSNQYETNSTPQS